MLNIFLALWLAFAGPAHHNSDNNNCKHPIGQVNSDLGGDNGNPPPPPPPH